MPLSVTSVARGRIAEDLALDWLQRQGLQLVTRNFRCRGGEIDLVMRQGQELVFIEVRARARASHGGAAASITSSKQAKLLLAAQVYLQRFKSLPPCRIDVLALDGDRIEWLRGAITM